MERVAALPAAVLLTCVLWRTSHERPGAMPGSGVRAAIASAIVSDVWSRP
jgi:hypothetical protein